jgi:hypothetical protein
LPDEGGDDSLEHMKVTASSFRVTLARFGLLVLASALLSVTETFAASGETPFENGEFSWRASGPLIDVDYGGSGPDPLVSIKDPTVVFHEGRWHMFATVRMKSGKVDIAYLNFQEWKDANQAPRQILALHDQYYCAPQVFYFRPQRRWYLVYQLAEKTRKPPFGPCFSTSATISDPKSWTRPLPMVTNAPPEPKWLDFWVICDEEKAHLFYTSLDGKMWRRETRKEDFPYGWSEQALALQADIFEASHTYRLKGMNKYLTIIEAQGDRRRYYKAYQADHLDGPWKGLADTLTRPFAATSNVHQERSWTDNISHGELIRSGVDEQLEVEPAGLQMVFQGATDTEYRSNNYGAIPWRLGLLQAAEEAPGPGTK